MQCFFRRGLQFSPPLTTPQGAHLMVSSHLPGNPKLVCHPACLIKEWGCVDLSLDTLHLKYPLVLFGSEGSALNLPLSVLSPRTIMLCHCSSTMKKDHFLLISYGTRLPLCVDVPLNTYSFIHSFHHLQVASQDVATIWQKEG